VFIFRDTTNVVDAICPAGTDDSEVVRVLRDFRIPVGEENGARAA
jgi:hypothetical protein